MSLKMTTIGQILDKNRGIGPGFDFLRIALAVSIVGFHCILELGHTSRHLIGLWYAQYAFVPMFFALSGFLVTASALRLSLKNFLINRCLRILPALSVDIVVCAMIIGPLTTTFPLARYFSDSEFFRYFLNITGWIHYTLPGVFKNRPNQMVNGALWTVPFEMFCYVLMSLLMLSRWVRRPLGVAAFLAVIMGVKLAVDYYHGGLAGDVYAPMPLPHIRATLAFIFNSTGTRLLVTFLLGIFFYQLKDKIPYSWPLFIACCLICAVTAIGHDRTHLTRILSNDFALLLPIVYITCFLGVTRVPLPAFLHKGDYSYGIYLYHDPFLQILIGLFPAAVLLKPLTPVVLFAIGLPVAFGVAFLSWHLVEKPILAMRKKFSFVAKVRGVEDAPATAPALPEGAGEAASS